MVSQKSFPEVNHDISTSKIYRQRCFKASLDHKKAVKQNTVKLLGRNDYNIIGNKPKRKDETVFIYEHSKKT